MNKKEKFIIFVYLAAMARDNETKTAEAARIATLACRIRDEVLPENTYNSAQVYVNYCHGRSRAFRWMKNVGLKPMRAKSVPGKCPAPAAPSRPQPEPEKDGA